MGILSRFTFLMKANINHIIDHSKNPEKVIKSTFREITLDLRTLQSENNALKADERRAKRELDECVADIRKMERFSERAAENGDDLKAQSFLDQKQELETKKQGLVAAYNNLTIEVKQMKLLEDKLALDIAQLEQRSAAIKDKTSVFNQYEEELNYKLDEANALAELRSNSSNSTMSIDEEIAALEANRETENN